MSLLNYRSDWEKAARIWLHALEATGYDNWEGYEIALDKFDEMLEEYGYSEQEIQDLKDTLSKY